MKRGILGAAIGIALGLLALMTLVVASTGWLLVLIVPEVLAVLVGGAAGFAIGWRLDRRCAPLRRFWTWLAVAIACWPLAVFAPVWARELQIQWIIARDLPAPPPDSKVLGKQVAVVAFDNNPGFKFSFTTPHSTRDVLRYYRAELPKLGWEVLPVLRGHGYLWHRYRKRGRTLLVLAYRGSYGEPGERVYFGYQMCLPNLSYACPELGGRDYQVVAPEHAFPDERPRGPYPPPVEVPAE